MSKVIPFLVLTLAATLAQANPKLLGVATSVADAKNTRIVEFKVTKVDGDKLEQVRNPYYGCSTENQSSTCDQEFVLAPVQVPGYRVVVQSDSKNNGDFEIAGDGQIQSNLVTREITFRASELPALALPKSKTSRLAAANQLFQLAGTSNVVKSDGAYACNSTSEGAPDEGGPVCYSPYSTTQYYLNLLTR